MGNDCKEKAELVPNNKQCSINHLPDDILDAIFLLLPGNDLLNSVILVCQKWKQTVDNDSFWIQKCLKNKHLIQSLQKRNITWRKYAKILYCTNFFDRNYLKNPRGNKQFDHWCICNQTFTSSFRDTKKFESSENNKKLIDFYKKNQIVRLTSTRSSNFNEKPKCVPVPNWRVEINQSYLSKKEDYLFDSFKTKGFGEKMQVIDLALEGSGLYPTFLNELKPDIEIYEYYRVHNSDCCEYYLSVFLISESFELVDSFLYRDKTEHLHSDWKCVYYKFVNANMSDKHLVRYILFYHAGRDTCGNFFGTKITNGSVKLLI